MRSAIWMALLCLVVAVVPPAGAQPLDLSGTWRLDTERSRVVDSAGLSGLIASGAPETLHITRAANGTVVVESRINESHARIYTPDAESSTPAGQGGRITTRSRIENRALISEGSREDATGVATAVREVLALSADGAVLTIEVRTTAAAGTQTSTLVYTRALSAGPCQTWPTPCKAPPPSVDGSTRSFGSLRRL
jgi:hypothetical protein